MWFYGRLGLKIVHDHLAEFDNYYIPYLKEMEEKAAKESGQVLD